MSPEIIREFVQSSWLINFLPLTPIAIVIFLIQSTLFLVFVLTADRLLNSNVANVRKFIWFWAMMMIPMITILANLTPATRADQYLAAAIDLSYLEDLVLNNELALPADNESVSVSGTTAVIGSEGFFTVLQIGTKYGMAGIVKCWNWLVFTYCLVALLLLARIPIGWKQLVRLRRTSTDADDERAARVYTQIADQIGYTGACQVRLTHELESPVSFGIRNPTILFPDKYYEQLSESELHATLLHELSHIKNHDPLRILLMKVIESLFFFQPLVWLASSRMYYLSELVADDSVLEAGVGAGCYANTIVNLIELGSEPSHQYKLSTGIFSSPRMLVSRIEHLLDETSGHRTKLVGKSLLASTLVLITALTATLQFSPRSSALEISSNGGEIAIDIEVASATPQQLSQNSDDLYLKLEVNKESTFVNEELELSIKLFYTINGIRSPQFTELLMPNSVIQSIDPPDQYEEKIDGVRYGVYEKRYVLIPQRSGPLVIPDISFQGEVTDGVSVTREISAFIEGLTIEVKEVPVVGL